LERLTYELKSIDNEESQFNLNYNHFNMDTLDYKRGYVNNINRIEKQVLPNDNNVINSLPCEINYEYNDNDELFYQNKQNTAIHNSKQNTNDNNEQNSLSDLSESWLNKSEENENSKIKVFEENNNILSCADRANQALLSMLSDDVKKLFTKEDFKELLSPSDISSEYSYDSSHSNKTSTQNLTSNNYPNMNSNQSFNSSKKAQEDYYSDTSLDRPSTYNNNISNISKQMLTPPSEIKYLNYDKKNQNKERLDISNSSSIIKEEYIDDYVYHLNDIRERFPLIYHSANLSEIATKFRKMIPLVKHVKDSIEYMDSFSGYDAITTISIILGNRDRKIAQTVGQILEEQGMFHDVIYLHKLIDSRHYYYQFKDLAKPIAILERKETAYMSSEKREKVLRKLSERNKNELEESNPCGVLTNMCQCYSPTCTENSPCYSCTCPRKRMMESITKDMIKNRFSDMDATIALQTNWSTSIGKFYVNKLKIEEIRRQESIYEFILSEKEYTLDLQYVIKYMIEPLRAGKVHGIDTKFVDKVFSNMEAIYKINRIFYENLRQVQKRKPILESIGDVVRDYVSQFSCYLQYGKNQPSAKQELQIQRDRNPLLDKFLLKCHKIPCFRHLPIESFLARPTTRLGRYPLFLRNIMSKTPELHRDQILLKEAIKTLESLLTKVNDLIGKEINRLKIEQWS